MSLSKELEAIFQHVVRFIEKKLHHLWYLRQSRFSNVLDVESDEMFLHLSKR
jgi:hypothetical protein